VLTSTERKLRARTAAYALHAQGGTNTGPATAASVARFERQVDPDGVLPPKERARRAAWARKSYMTALSLKAHRARNKKTATAVSETSAVAAESTEGTSNAASTV
jgi:hypothetical protein